MKVGEELLKTGRDSVGMLEGHSDAELMEVAKGSKYL